MTFHACDRFLYRLDRWCGGHGCGGRWECPDCVLVSVETDRGVFYGIPQGREDHFIQIWNCPFCGGDLYEPVKPPRLQSIHIE